jgi:hypothetical protein
MAMVLPSGSLIQAALKSPPSKTPRSLVLMPGLVGVVRGPAGEGRRRRARVVWLQIDEEAGSLCAEVADALLFLLAGHQPELVLVEASCHVEV